MGEETIEFERARVVTAAPGTATWKDHVKSPWWKIYHPITFSSPIFAMVGLSFLLWVLQWALHDTQAVTGNAFLDDPWWRQTGAFATYFFLLVFGLIPWEMHDEDSWRCWSRFNTFVNLWLAMGHVLLTYAVWQNNPIFKIAGVASYLMLAFGGWYFHLKQADGHRGLLMRTGLITTELAGETRFKDKDLRNATISQRQERTPAITAVRVDNPTPQQRAEVAEVATLIVQQSRSDIVDSAMNAVIPNASVFNVEYLLRIPAMYIEVWANAIAFFLVGWLILLLAYVSRDENSHPDSAFTTFTGNLWYVNSPLAGVMLTVWMSMIEWPNCGSNPKGYRGRDYHSWMHDIYNTFLAALISTAIGTYIWCLQSQQNAVWFWLPYSFLFGFALITGLSHLARIPSIYLAHLLNSQLDGKLSRTVERSRPQISV